jgi:hypothetical protein
LRELQAARISCGSPENSVFVFARPRARILMGMRSANARGVAL